MADRKVLIKYFPKNFDHQRLVKRGRGKDKLMIVRNMLPMSLRCNTCSNYLYIGTKFNMRMEICNEEAYLGIKIFRFYFKCTTCYAEISFKTDPKNHDYIVEAGGTRNYEHIKDAQHAENILKKMKMEQKEGDSMKYLQNKTYDSKREMELMEALEDIKTLNLRHTFIDPETLLKNMLYEEDQHQGFTEEEEAQIQAKYQMMKLNKQLNLGVIQEEQEDKKIENNQQIEQQKRYEDQNQNLAGKIIVHKLNNQTINKVKQTGVHTTEKKNAFITPTKSKLNNYKKRIYKPQK